MKVTTSNFKACQSFGESKTKHSLTTIITYINLKLEKKEVISVFPACKHWNPSAETAISTKPHSYTLISTTPISAVLVCVWKPNNQVQ